MNLGAWHLVRSQRMRGQEARRGNSESRMATEKHKVGETACKQPRRWCHEKGKCGLVRGCGEMARREERGRGGWEDVFGRCPTRPAGDFKGG